METGKFYNKEIKERFLNNYPPDSQSTYAVVFRKSAELEDFAEKDLYDFSISQVEKIIRTMQFTTLNAAKTFGRVISSYFNWAIENELRKEDNPLKNIGNDWFQQFVKEEKHYYSEKELIYIEDHLVNYQDKVIPRLLFEGVNGEMSSELINLRAQDIDENTLHLKSDDGRERSIQVSDRAISFIEKALKESQYLNKNGEATGKRAVSRLVENDYVLRSTYSKATINTNRASNYLIYRRLSTIGEIFGLENFKAKNIWRSGIIKMGMDFYNKNHQITEEQYNEIINQFGMKPYSIKNKEVYRLDILEKLILDNGKILYGES